MRKLCRSIDYDDKIFFSKGELPSKLSCLGILQAKDVEACYLS